MMRCVKCGCSRFDTTGFGCAICGGSPAIRSEQCHVTDDTKAKLLANAEELRGFGINLEEQKLLQKSVDALALIGIGLAIAESFNSGVLRKLVLYLRDIGINESEILRLRLDEPEKISDALKADKDMDHGD